MRDRSYPYEWTVAPVSDAAERCSGSTTIGPFGSNLVAGDYRAAGVPVVFVRDVRESGFEWRSEVYVDPRKAQQLAAHEVRPGDLLATKMGEPPCVAAEYPTTLPAGIITADIIRLRPDSARSHVRWLVRAINGEGVRAQVRAITGGVTRPKVTLRDFRTLQVPLPPLPEQRQIAAILDTLDDAIRKTEQIIAKLKQVKQGLLHDLLTRGIDDNGELRDPDRHPEQFKESPLGRIPKAWEVARLGEVAEVDRGKFTHRPRNDPAFYGGRFPFIQTGDVAAAEGRTLLSASQSLNERGAGVSREFPRGTIAITIAANIADTAILGIPMFFPDSVVGAIVFPPNSVRFIQLCIQRAKTRLEARAPQSAQRNINLQDLRPLQLALAGANEQARIAQAYEAEVARLEHETASAEKLRTLKAGLMEDLLTGAVRVTALLDNASLNEVSA